MNETHSFDDKSRQLEQIVAYLDGELSPQESAQVERRLASDEQYRRHLQGIDRAWAALDQLPAATVDDNFSKTTMELVVGAAHSEVHQRTQALPVERRRRRLSTVLLATAAILLGALAYRVQSDNSNRALLVDLPVIEYIDIYSQFREVEFLRQLRRELGVGGWPGISSEDPSDQLQQFHWVASHESRVQWLESLEEDELVTLRAKFNRFRALSEQQQDRLRTLHQEIESAPDSNELQQTMLEYQQWLNGLPPSEQFELREKPEEAVRRVVHMVEEQRRNELFTLSREELLAVKRAVQPRLEAMRAQALEAMSPHEREEFDSSFGRGRIWRIIGRIPPERRTEFSRAVQAALPPEKRARFEQLSPPERSQLMSGWLRQAVRADSPDRREGDRRHRRWIPEQELEEFFVEEVDAATKERLLALPRDKMQPQLRQMYEGVLSPRNSSEPEDIDRERRRGDGPPPWFQDRRDQQPPERGPPDRPPHFREGPPGPPPPAG